VLTDWGLKQVQSAVTGRIWYAVVYSKKLSSEVYNFDVTIYLRPIGKIQIRSGAALSQYKADVVRLEASRALGSCSNLRQRRVESCERLQYYIQELYIRST